MQQATVNVLVIQTDSGHRVSEYYDSTNAKVLVVDWIGTETRILGPFGSLPENEDAFTYRKSDHFDTARKRTQPVHSLNADIQSNYTRWYPDGMLALCFVVCVCIPHTHCYSGFHRFHLVHTTFSLPFHTTTVFLRGDR